MLKPSDLFGHALRLLEHSDAVFSEIDCRRAVSATYYALFHTLTTTGANLLAAGGSNVLKNQIARGFNHGVMRQVCLVFKSASTKGFQSPYTVLLPATIDGRIFTIAEAFLRLQEVRHTADYDLLAPINLNDTLNDMRLALIAMRDMQIIESTPEARVFLTALLLADRWTRRG